MELLPTLITRPMASMIVPWGDGAGEVNLVARYSNHAHAAETGCGDKCYLVHDMQGGAAQKGCIKNWGSILNA